MADLLTGDQLNQLFRAVRRSAFRLETRDRYNVPNEEATLRRFLAGDPDESYLGNSWWSDMTREAAQAGRPFSRVRVVSVPLTDYARYALWSAQGNIASGEEIRYLERDRAQALGLPVRPPHDAWLLDDEQVVVLHFDVDDAFVGAELCTDPAVIDQHQRWRRLAWEASISRDEFLRALDDHASAGP